MKSTFEGLSKRLGALDKERREILTALKKTPEYCLQLLKQLLDSFISTNSKAWFSRANDKGQTAYFQLVAYEFLPTKTLALPHLNRKRAVAVPSTVNITKNNAVIAKVRLKWAVYDYDSPIKVERTEEMDISIFNDIETQVLNGRKHSKFDEKNMVRAALKVKQKALEDQLKAIKGEIALIK